MQGVRASGWHVLHQHLDPLGSNSSSSSSHEQSSVAVSPEQHLLVHLLGFECSSSTCGSGCMLSAKSSGSLSGGARCGEASRDSRKLRSGLEQEDVLVPESSSQMSSKLGKRAGRFCKRRRQSDAAAKPASNWSNVTCLLKVWSVSSVEPHGVRAATQPQSVFRDFAAGPSAHGLTCCLFFFNEACGPRCMLGSRSTLCIHNPGSVIVKQITKAMGW